MHSVSDNVPFGRARGRAARLFTLQSDLLTARITDYAGALVSLEAPDRSGARDHIVLGFGDVAGYIDIRGSFGALLGRNANRIADGRIVIDGRVYELSKNENGATLHGGADGFGKRFWSVLEFDAQHLTLALVSPDGDQGFPGAITAEATWSVVGGDLSLCFVARTTKPTPLSLSAHPYFNLDGPLARDCLDHQVEIFPDTYLQTDQKQIPAGDVATVANTPFDFRHARNIGERIREPKPQLCYGRGYDHYFVLPEGDTGALRLAPSVARAAAACCKS